MNNEFKNIMVTTGITEATWEQFKKKTKRDGKLVGYALNDLIQEYLQSTKEDKLITNLRKTNDGYFIEIKNENGDTVFKDHRWAEEIGEDLDINEVYDAYWEYQIMEIENAKK